MSHILTIQENIVSIRRLRVALAVAIAKYKVFHTEVKANKETSNQQTLLSVDDEQVLFKLSIVSGDDELQAILDEETTNRAFFNFGQGRLLCCHVVRRSLNNDEDLLRTNDIVIFHFDYNIFENYSLNLFYRDISVAYSSGYLLPNEFEEKRDMKSE